MGIHYPCLLPNLNAYSGNNEFVNNNHAEMILSLPIGEHLTDEEVDYVIEKVNNFFEVNE